jgi:peptidoglycan/LPS O-acetylase OafA/YrhL
MVGRDHRRGYVYAFLVLILIGTNFIGFIAGLILADIYHNRDRVYKFIANLSVFYKTFALTVAIYMASFPPLRNAENLSLVHRPLLFLDNYVLNQTIVHLIAAVIIIVLMLTSKRLNKLFELKPLVFLGSISYSMYAIHLLILGSAGSLAFYVAQSYGLPYNYSAAIAMGAYLPTILIASLLMNKFVDQPAIALSRMAGRSLFARSETNSKDKAEAAKLIAENT